LGLFASFAWRFIHLFHKVPIAGVDLADSCLIGRHNFFLIKNARLFFKRELPSDHWLAFARSGYPSFPGQRWRRDQRYIEMIKKLRPISFGVHASDAEIGPAIADRANNDKINDVFFVGAVAGNSSVRAAGFTDLEQLKQEGYKIDLPVERMPPREFYLRMSKARLAWSPGGLGWDCGRHYQAAIVGTVPLINFPTILRDAPMVEGEHCLFYAPEPGGLARAIRQALADKTRLGEMARAAAAHVERHHTDRARIERLVVAVLGRRLDGSIVEK
jgi:hypothetical protein